MKNKRSIKILTVVSTCLLGIGGLLWQTGPTSNAQKSIIEKSGKTISKASAADLTDRSSVIYLNAAKIDVKSAEAQALRQKVDGFSGKKMHLVRFDGPIQASWYKMLTGSGLEIIDYIPNYTYLVYGNAESLQKIQTSAKSVKNHIEWEGSYRDEYRISPNVYQQSAETEKLSLSSDYFTVQLYKDDEANAQTLSLINALQTAPIKSQSQVLHYVNIKVGLNDDGLKQIAARPDVISIQPYFEPRKLDEKQDIILTGNVPSGIPVYQNYLSYLASKGFTQAQFDASGFAVNLSDSGIDNGTQAPNHFALYKGGAPASGSRIIYNRLEGTANTGSTIQAQDGHGNINSHIIGGFVPDSLIGVAPHSDANSYRYGLGVAPFVKIGSSVIFDPDTFTSPVYTNLEAEAYRDGARISSNSWGSNSNAYTADAQSYDSLVRDAQQTGSTSAAAGNQEYIIVFAAGNGGSGANTVGEPGTAKNVITVGASENVRAFGGADGCAVDDTGADNANDIIGFSSRGPTSDGRKKPDIVGPGTHVTGGAPQASLASPAGSGTGTALGIFDGGGVCGGVGSNFFPSAGQQYYTASSGTSHSTPAIAGVAALIRQNFINQSLTPPTPAMTKALLGASSRYMSGVGANDSLPSNNQGLGEMSLNNYFDIVAAPHIFKDELNADRFTATGQQRVITGTISDNTKPFRVVLAWTDAPGATTGNAFVNNLDLEVTAGGQTYKGNVFSGSASATGGTADTRNNVESVLLPAGVTGNFVLKVKATNIAGDGVPNNADLLDQDYSLVVSNATEAALPVLQTAGLTVTAESCAPSNGAIDPDETVTVNLALSNVGTSNTTNLVATLQATGGVTAPSAAQNYGALVANGASVSRPFTFTAAALCGQTLTLTLQLQDGASNLGTVTQTVRVGALGNAVPSNQTTGNITTAIPDVSSVDIPINVTQTGAIADINVKVRANHTFDGDLVFDLISPDGTSVNLATNRGSSGDNFGSGANDCSGTPTVFDDAAATAIGAGTAPFAGSFKPDGLLSAFNGKNLAGNWILRVTDTASGDTGTVGCVQLEVSRQPFACCGSTGTPTIASGGNAVLTAESVTPHNSTPDPNETVTVNLPVVNTGDGPTTNLVGTLQATGGVLTPSGPQNYGVLTAGGPAVSRPFTFVANGACGSNITLTLALQDGAVNYGTITYTMRLGTVSSSVQTFSNTAAITIPGTGSGASTGAPATPYPSNVTVAGFTNPVTNVAVTLNGFQHSFPDDVDILLVGPTGVKFIVMSDSGSLGAVAAPGINLTIDDTAAAPLPDGSGLVTGSFKPANYGTGDVFPAPAPAAPYLSPATAGADTFATAFNGLNPNGTWSLYVVDDASGDVGAIAGGWSLTLTSASNVCNTQACSLAAPANIVTYNYNSPTGAVVNYPSAGITGSCGIVTYNPPSGSFFPIGTTTVNINSANLAENQPSVVAAPTAATSFTVTVNLVTAAGATVSGIVQNSAGRAISGAAVSLTDTQGNALTVRTNPFGYFRFNDVHTGSTYVANVSAKGFRFAPSVLTINQDATDLKFVAIP